jgi:ABC-type branched-subunit amino acid transport system ATPase component
MARSIGADVAQEHLADGQDCVKEAINTIRRVLKSFPDLAPELNQATAQLTLARESMQSAGRRLPK